MVSVFINNISDTMLFARQELCNYMLKITEGIRFEPTVAQSDKGVRLIVQPTLTRNTVSDGERENDCYKIEANGTDITIVGNSERSVLLGVYRYLTECGYLFLGPGEEHEQIPDKIDLKQKKVRIFEQAHFHNRGISLEGANSLEDVLRVIDWIPKLGGNSFFNRLKNPYVFFKRWYEHDHNPKLSAEPFSVNVVEYMIKKIEYELSKRSLLNSCLSHEWCNGKLDFSKGQTLQDQGTKLGLTNSERSLYNPNPKSKKLCLFNEKDCHLFIEGVVSYAVSHPNVSYLHIELLDAFDNECNCHLCQNKEFSERYSEILNKLDEYLTKENLSTQLCIEERYGIFKVSVFQNLNSPNRFVRTVVPNRDSFQVNMKESRLLESKRDFRKIPSIMFDSPLNFTHFGDLGYLSLSKIISEDIQALSSVDISGYISSQELRVGLPNHFPNYVMAKMSWNPSLEFDDLAKEYFEGAYGPEWKKVYRYLEYLSDLSSPDYVSGRGSRIDNEVASDFSKISKIIIRFSPVTVSHFRMENKVHRNYWQVLSYHDLFCERWCKLLFYKALGQEDAVAKEAKLLLEFIRDNERDYRSYLDVYSFVEGTTAYTGIEI